MIHIKKLSNHFHEYLDSVRPKKVQLKIKLIFIFSIFILVSVCYMYMLSNKIYMGIITNLLDEFSVETLINKSSVLDTRLKQYDLLSLDLLSNKDVHNILSINETDTYANAEGYKIFNSISSNMAIQLQTPHLYSVVLRSKMNAYFSPKSNAFSGDATNNTNIENYNNKFYSKLKANEGRITFIDTDEYKFNVTRKQKCFAMGRLIQDISKNEQGYMVIFIKYDFFQEIFNNTFPGSNSTFCILGQDDSVIYSSSDSAGKMAELRQQYSLIPRDKNSAIVKDAWGIPYLLTYYTSSYSGWTLVNMVPVLDLLSGIQFNRSLTILFCILFFILSVIIAAYISSTISKPIKSLVSTMRGIIKGDMSLRAQVYGGYEIKELCSHFNGMIEKITQLMQENKDKQDALMKTELSMLQAQINPHFLYNTLNSIRWISIINKQDQIKNLIDDLSKLFMNSFKMENEFIRIEDELSILQSYVNIMKVRYNNFKLSVDLDNSLLDYKILKFLIQPFIENSIIHGFAKIGYLGIISLSFKKEDGCLMIRIEDNGTGIPEDLRTRIPQPDGKKSSSFSSIGIYNVDKRIQLHYGKSYGVKINDCTTSGTVIEIRLPLLE